MVCDDLGCLCCIDECWYFIILYDELFGNVEIFNYFGKLVLMVRVVVMVVSFVS